MLGYQELLLLCSSRGEKLLSDAARMEGDLLSRITHLRKSYPADHVSAAVELDSLRKRAKSKFEMGDRMFFTAQGLEQSSGDRIATWRANRFPSDTQFVDLCCGNGGDTTALGRRGPVIAFDLDPSAALCAKLNSRVHDLDSRASVACCDVTQLRMNNLSGADAIFFDPSRRKGGRRVSAGEEYSPPLDFVPDVLKSNPNLCVKVSPALDDDTLADLQKQGARIEFVSDQKECKEALLWFGEFGPDTDISASLVADNVSLTVNSAIPDATVSEPLNWLHEPDPAVIRAHLISEMAHTLNASRLDEQIAYLTSESAATSPFSTAYRILEWMPFNLKRVQKRLREMGRTVYAIKRRGVPLDPIQLQRQLTGAGDQEAVVVLTRVNGAPAAIICQRPAPFETV